MSSDRVLIIGGGLAGLACGLTLKNAGKEFLILERGPVPGGRVMTVEEDGFRFDAGFQVLLDSYPELSRFLDLDALDLQTFNSGAKIFDGSRTKLLANPVSHWQEALSTAWSNSVGISDQLKMLSLVAASQFVRDDRQFKNISTLDYLIAHGFSREFIDFFWRPFLAGVYLDENLSVDGGFFLFLLRCFSMGSVTVPAKGMAQIPAQMAAQIPSENIRCNAAVKEFGANFVTLESGERLQASAVVNATPRAQKEWRSVETHYLSCDEEPDWDRWLVLVPSHLNFKINHLALISAVAPLYAPPGKFLISASVIGPKTAEPAEVVREVSRLNNSPLKLRHLRTFKIDRALPVMNGTPVGVGIVNGVFDCGDRCTSPSINGALRSGREAAELVLRPVEGVKSTSEKKQSTAEIA